VVSNEVGSDGKTRGLNGLEEGASKTGRRHFWHRSVRSCLWVHASIDPFRFN
jgi:hypothetical protein